MLSEAALTISGTEYRNASFWCYMKVIEPNARERPNDSNPTVTKHRVLKRLHLLPAETRARSNSLYLYVRARFTTNLYLLLPTKECSWFC